MATVREKLTGPSRRPRCTVAIPPDAISSWIAYRPTTPVGRIADAFIEVRIPGGRPAVAESTRFQ
jgi:hypothetical protein